MKVSAIMTHVTAFFVFVQMITGGTWLIDKIELGHFETGILTAVLSFIALILSFAARPRYAAFAYSNLLLFLLVLLTGYFSQKDGAMFAHYTFALLSFGVAVASTFYATRWSRMAGKESKDRPAT